jgi:acetoin utilization deacetylase AcuC-like enzyme
MPPRLFCTDEYPLPLPPGHKFPISKYRLLRTRLEQTNLFALEAAPLANRETITLAHEANYVDDFLHGTRCSHPTYRVSMVTRARNSHARVSGRNTGGD